MKTEIKTIDVRTLQLGEIAFPPEEVVEYLGVVNYATNERVLGEIKERMEEAPGAPISLVVTSAGGPSGTAMSFYDTIRTLLKPNLTTIGSGDVDSSGLIIFLAGDRRYVTAHTTALLHPAGRYFEKGVRYTAKDLVSMAREDEAKDKNYAQIVAERSRGKLSVAVVHELMEANTLLSPQDFLTYGLADTVLS